MEKYQREFSEYYYNLKNSQKRSLSERKMDSRTMGKNNYSKKRTISKTSKRGSRLQKFVNKLIISLTIMVLYTGVYFLDFSFSKDMKINVEKYILNNKINEEYAENFLSKIDKEEILNTINKTKASIIDIVMD